MEQVIVNGLYLGAQYALIALGLTLIFALMNVLNFAHGQMYVLGGFVTYTVYGQWHLPFVVALIASSVTLAILGALIEKFLFRPVIRRSKREESTMLLAAAIAFFLDAVILLVFGEKGHGVPKIVNGVLNTGAIIIPYDRILVGVPRGGVHRRRSWPSCSSAKTGRAMRALAQDRSGGAADGRQCRPLFDDRLRARRAARRPRRRAAGRRSPASARASAAPSRPRPS